MADAIAPPFDLARTHRWFAVEANNLAWELVEANDRSAADAERMVHAAHAAAFHWSHAGTTVNALRAECLLATAYHAAGRSEPAAVHATRCLAALDIAADEATAFDRAAAWATAAEVFDTVDRHMEAEALRVNAWATVDTFDDADDRAVLERLYPGVRR